MSRRTVFFLGAAALCLALVPVADSAQRWVPAAMTVVYVLLALGTFLDERSAASRR